MNYTRKLGNKIKFLLHLYQIFVKEKYHIHSASHRPRLPPGNWLPTGVRHDTRTTQIRYVEEFIVSRIDFY